MGSFGVSFVVEVVCGFLVMLGVLCYVELGVLVFKFGGEYVYILRTFGFRLVFLVIYTFVLVGRLVVIVVVFLSFVEYVVVLFYLGCFLLF